MGKFVCVCFGRGGGDHIEIRNLKSLRKHGLIEGRNAFMRRQKKDPIFYYFYQNIYFLNTLYKMVLHIYSCRTITYIVTYVHILIYPKKVGISMDVPSTT